MELLVITRIDTKNQDRSTVVAKTPLRLMQVIARTYCKVAKGDKCKRNCRRCQFEPTSQYFNLAKFTFCKMLEQETPAERQEREQIAQELKNLLLKDVAALKGKNDKEPENAKSSN